MKITIDTKEDSHEDIIKIVNVLKVILGEHPTNSASSVDSSAMMSMFADPAAGKTEKEIPDTPPDFSSFLNLTKPKKENDEECKIEFF